MGLPLKTYGLKVVMSGKVIEVYEYLKPIKMGGVNNKNGRSAVPSDSVDIEVNRDKVLKRARKELRRIVNSNIQKGSKFLTLTFKDNVQDLEFANYEFKKFIKRLDYYLGFKTQYSTVVEFQKRGAIHYHTILYNVPGKLSVAKIEGIWGNGFIKINNIKNVDNVGAYICKYMQKCEDEKKLRGKKMYFNSRGLNKPVEIKEPELAKITVESLKANQTPKYSNVFENDFNITYYKQYIISGE